jgi:hypothetical protein
MNAAGPAGQEERERTEGDLGMLEDESAPEDVDYSDLLAPFEDDGDLDDTVAEELRPGIDLDDLEDDADDDAFEASIDVGSLVPGAMPEEEADADEAVGSAELDIGDTLTDLGGPLEDDDTDEEDIAQLLEEMLPPLGEGEDDDVRGHTDLAPLIELEEDAVRGVREPWPLIHVEVARGPRYALHIEAGGVLLVGRSVERWTRGGAREELVAPAPLLTGLAPTPSGLMVVTASGDVLHLERGTLHPNTAWHRALDVRPEEAHELSLAGEGDLVFLRTASGRLARTTDGGRHWTGVDVGGPVIAMTPGLPLYVIARIGGAPSLLRADLDGTFAPIPTTGAERLLSPGCRLVAGDTFVALGHPNGALAISCDGGRTFTRPPGMGSITALALGRLHGGMQLFAATYSAAGNTAALVRVDTTTHEARLLAEIHASDDEDDAVVSALAFDESERALWAVGAFGVRVITRPD